MNRPIDQYPQMAVALKYDGVNAPKITAKGEGDIARQILETAKANGIPLEQDAELVRLLAQIPLGDQIPENLYRVIAEIIAFAYYLSGRMPPGFEQPH